MCERLPYCPRLYERIFIWSVLLMNKAQTEADFDRALGLIEWCYMSQSMRVNV